MSIFKIEIIKQKMLLYFNFQNGEFMSTLTVADAPPIPALPRFVNSASSVIVDLFLEKALPYPICGAALGYFYDKPITFSLCSTTQMVIWNYLTPYTIGLLFINKHSNFSSNLIGHTLTYGTGILGSYYLTKKLLEVIPQRVAGQERIVKENEKPFLIRQAVYLSVASLSPLLVLRAALSVTGALLNLMKKS